MGVTKFIDNNNAQVLAQGIWDKYKSDILSKIDTVINSSSTDSKITSAKAVYDFVVSSIGNLTLLKIQKVDTLPVTGEGLVIYLTSNDGSEQNIFDEWLWIDDAWELIGTTKIDLTNYWDKTDLVAMTTEEINTILDNLS